MRTPMKMLGALTALSLLLCSCAAGADTAVDIEPAGAASTLLEQVEFRDTLVRAEGGAAENYYRLDESVGEYAIYISGSGATAEEIAVIKVAQGHELRSVEEIVNRRVETLRTQFEDYVPQEMVKLASPVIVGRGDVVVLVIADDSAQAQKAAEALFA